MANVEKRWYALRIVASIQALFAWLASIGVLGYGIFMGVVTIINAPGLEQQILGGGMIAGSFVACILVWAIYMAVAQMIRLLIALEENTRIMASKS